MLAFVIASHGRLGILKQNIKHLLNYGDIFLTVSYEEDDRFIYHNFINEIDDPFPKLHYSTGPNNPLGNKWQRCVDMARSVNPSLLITCGSDDFISTDYIENAMKILDKGYDFVGANYWYMTDGRSHYKAKYRHRQDFPAGSGRVFTKKCLDAINWEVFDRKKDRLLDDKALEQIKKAKIKTYISQEPEKDGLRILAVKGNWDCLNPMQKFLTSKTVTMERIIILPEQFPTIEINPTCVV